MPARFPFAETRLAFRFKWLWVGYECIKSGPFVCCKRASGRCINHVFQRGWHQIMIVHPDSLEGETNTMKDAHLLTGLVVPTRSAATALFDRTQPVFEGDSFLNRFARLQTLYGNKQPLPGLEPLPVKMEVGKAFVNISLKLITAGDGGDDFKRKRRPRHKGLKTPFRQRRASDLDRAIHRDRSDKIYLSWRLHAACSGARNSEMNLFTRSTRRRLGIRCCRPSPPRRSRTRLGSPTAARPKAVADMPLLVRKASISARNDS